MRYGDRVQETSQTTGTGTLTLVGATVGHRTFLTGVGSGNVCTYLLKSGDAWELGTGTVGAGTLTRSVRFSSNSNNLLNLSASVHYVSCIVDSEEFENFSWNITTTGISKTLVQSEFCTPTATGLTLTLPASPKVGRKVRVYTNTYTNTIIARNAQNIMGLAENMTLDLANTTVELMFADATRGWVIV